MDTTTLKIIDTLSTTIGTPLSINQLTQQIKKTHGSAYYANIYQKLQELKNQGLLSIEPIGRSSNVKLNFQNYLLTDLLAEMEIEKKRALLENRNNLIPVLKEIEEKLAESAHVKSASLVNPESNLKLNRIELLFLTANSTGYIDETASLLRAMGETQNRYNTKINSLILNQKEFSELTHSDEINPIKEAIANKIAFFGPQSFWTQLKAAIREGQICLAQSETKPSKIEVADLTFNLYRFGYREFGEPLIEGKEICLEYIVTSILLGDDARLTEAVAVVLAKNRFRANVLVFLSQKYNTAEKLLGLVRALDSVVSKADIKQTVKLLEALETKQAPVDAASIIQKLRLYNAL